MDALVEHLSADAAAGPMAAFCALQMVVWYFGVPFWYHVLGRALRQFSWYEKVREKGRHAEVLTQLSTTSYYIQAMVLMRVGVHLAGGPGDCIQNNAFWYGLMTQIGHDLQDLIKIALEVPRYPHTSIRPNWTGKPLLRRSVVLTSFHHAGVFTCCYLPLDAGPWPGIDLWWIGAPGTVVIKNLYNAARVAVECNGADADTLAVLHLVGFLGWTLPRAVLTYDALVVCLFTPGLSWLYLVTWSLMGYTIADNSRVIFRRLVHSVRERVAPPVARSPSVTRVAAGHSAPRLNVAESQSSLSASVSPEHTSNSSSGPSPRR